MIFGLDSGAEARVIHRSRRLSARFPDQPTCVVLWGLRSEEEALRERLEAAGASRTATSITEALEAVRHVAAHQNGRTSKPRTEPAASG
jgi:hypothetical protein